MANLTNYSDNMILVEARALLIPESSTYKGAEQLGISQSTIWYHLNYRLPKINYSLYLEVREVLNYNSKGGADKASFFFQAFLAFTISPLSGIINIRR